HEAGNVGRIARTRSTRATEGALRDASVGQAREDAAAMLEPDDLLGRIFAHRRDCVLIAKIVGAFDGVKGVCLRGVFLAIAKRGVDTALRGARVTAYRVHF